MSGRDSPEQNESLTGEMDISFSQRCEEVLADQRVVVESAAGHRFEGLLTQVDLANRHVLLTDVQELPAGTEYATAFVAEVDWIVNANDRG